MKVFKLLLCVVIGLVCAGAAHAQPIPIIELDRDYRSAELAQNLIYSRNYDGELTLEAIASRRAEFQMLSENQMFFGVARLPILMVIGVSNPSTETRTWILKSNRHNANHFQVHVLTREGETLVFDSASFLAEGRSERRYLAYGTSFSLSPGEEVFLAIDADFENTGNIEIDLLTPRTFFDEYHARLIVQSVVAAVFLTTILINMVLFGATGRRAFLWLSLAEAFLFYYLLNMTGLLFSMGLFQNPIPQYVSMQMSFWIASICFLQFWRQILRSEREHPILDIILTLGMAVCGAVALLWFAGYFSDSVTRYKLAVASWAVIIPVGLSAPLLGYATVYKLGRIYWPLFIGVSAYALVSILIFLDVEIARGYSFHVPSAIAVAAAFECFMITISLGWSILHTSEERVRLLEERVALNEQNALASATIRDQGAMLQASGHDTRQVLLAINSAADHLERTSGAHDNRLVHTLKESAHFLQDILSTTLSAQRTHTADRRCVALSSFSVSELFRSLERIYTSAFRQKGIELSVELTGDMSLISDRALLMRALSNFVANSLKATAEGQVVCGAEQDGESLRIFIRDTGSGIDADLMEYLLNDAPAPEGMDRSPSGVKIAHSIIESLGGSLAIQSEIGSGTTVELSVPHVVGATQAVSVANWQSATGLTVEDLDATEPSDQHPVEHGLGVTFDDSPQMRARASERRSLLLYKPLVMEMAEHPLVKASRPAQ